MSSVTMLPAWAVLLCLLTFLIPSNQADNPELTNSEIVDTVTEFPFLARIHIRSSVMNDHTICGASLLDSETLVTALHCVEHFYKFCLEVHHCYARFRDNDRSKHENGQFRVDIITAFLKPGRGDLALLKLKHPVEEHPDYDRGVPLTPIKMSLSLPEPGETAITAGWGATGYNRGESLKLRKLNLTVLRHDDHWIYTDSSVMVEGVPSDPCAGDSGGPLIIWREEEWKIAGTLFVSMEGGREGCAYCITLSSG